MAAIMPGVRGGECGERVGDRGERVGEGVCVGKSRG